MKLADLCPTHDDLDEGWKHWAMAGLLGAGLAGDVPRSTQTTSTQQPTASAVQAQDPGPPEVRQPDRRNGTVVALTNHPNEHALLRAAQASGITGLELAQLMAQARHETENFTRLTERGGSLDFRKYDPQYNPARAQILGNTERGDGAKYRGRGFLHITGKYWYQRIGQAIGENLVRHPERLADPDIGARATIWFWNNQVRNRVADPTDTAQVTRRIHPGSRALAERERFFNEYRNAMVMQEDADLRWASGPDIDKAVIKYRQRDPDYVVVNANIEDLFRNTWPSYALDINDPKGGRNAIGNRIERAKQHWASGAHMDPSEISVQTDHHGPAVVWQDGRHRLAAARQMGHEYGQVVVPRSDLDQLRKMVRIRP